LIFSSKERFGENAAQKALDGQTSETQNSCKNNYIANVSVFYLTCKV